MTTALIYDPLFLDHDTGPQHPENPNRLKVMINELQADQKLWRSLKHVSPIPATMNDILRCHTQQLIDHVKKCCEHGPRYYIDADTVVSPKSFDIALLAAGAGIVAVDQLFTEQVSNAFVLARPPGHHATINQAMGFCIFNNIAIAARYAQATYNIKKILIIDWDVHHGNGTQDIFYNDPTVYYFSTHQFPFYPGTGATDETGNGLGNGTTLNIPLATGTSAAQHRDVFSAGLNTILQSFHPELILISAGFDARVFDPLANLNLTDQDYVEMTKEVMQIAKQNANNRIISFLEGGYNLGTIGKAVTAHISTLSHVD